MPRKVVTRLTWKLRESLAVTREARQRQVALDQLIEEQAERRERRMTRREFLSVAASATAGLALWRPLRISGNRSRIVVVGAGLAGLRFAHALWTRKGIAANLYEANTRLGGRCWTNRASFGIIVSLGGFTRGAIDFARDKPIYFLDVSDLIAMQEGCDVLADAFSASSPKR